MVFRLPFLFPQSWASFSLFFDTNWKMPLVLSTHWIQDAISGLHRDSWRYSNSRSFFLPKMEKNNVIVHRGYTQRTSSGRVCFVTTKLKAALGLQSQTSVWPYWSFSWTVLCWGCLKNFVLSFTGKRKPDASLSESTLCQGIFLRN